MVPDVLPSKRLLSSIANDSLNARHVYRDRTSLRVSEHRDTTKTYEEQHNDPYKGCSLICSTNTFWENVFSSSLSITSPLLYLILLFIQWGYHWWDVYHLESRTRQISPLTSAWETLHHAAIYLCLYWGAPTKKETGWFIFKSSWAPSLLLKAKIAISFQRLKHKS